MTRREQLEMVILQNAYGSVAGSPAVRPIKVQVHLRDLVDAILACWPEPSREQLVLLFGYHFRHFSHPEPCEQLRSDLMAWAIGTPPTPSPQEVPVPAYEQRNLLKDDFGLCLCCKQCGTHCTCAAPRPAAGG